jgi:hypothetical protein
MLENVIKSIPSNPNRGYTISELADIACNTYPNLKTMKNGGIGQVKGEITCYCSAHNPKIRQKFFAIRNMVEKKQLNKNTKRMAKHFYFN